MKVEDLVEAYMIKREEDAWLEMKDKMVRDTMSQSLKELVRDAFIIGYEKGSIDKQDEILEMSKSDQIGFYNWMAACHISK